MKAAVVGSGAWGTALAVRLCKNGHDVTMWTYEKDKIPITIPAFPRRYCRKP